MILHRLELQAFGPFAERAVVDLDAASAAGLFLVHGPTGSGKTSLLDAICFALYADVPGSRSRRGLRSDHASPETPPEVVLELTVSGRRLRLTRSPEWQRPKRRGTGTTRVPAAVVLEERRGSGWEAVSTRHDEVADVVADLLGMGMQQFATVVLLPQGEFATFLRAEPEARRELLQRLFDIGVFSDVEQWLADTRRETVAALEAAGAELEHDLLRLADALEALATADPELVVGDPAPEMLPRRLAEIATRLGDRVTASVTELDALEATEAAAHQALATGRELLGHRRRGEQATAALAELATAEQAHRERAARLAACEQAAALRGHLAALERAREEVRTEAAEAESRRAAATALGVDPCGDEPAVLAERAGSLDDAAGEVDRLTLTARELATSLEGLLTRRDRLEAQQAGLAEELPAARSAAEQAGETATAVAAEAARATDLAAAVEEVEHRLGLLAEADADAARAAALEPALLAGRERLSGLLGQLIELQHRRLEGMAAELADRLEPGTPCPVCGAAEHPDPAVAADPVSPEQLAAAQDAVEHARVEVDHTEGAVRDLLAAVRTREEVLGGATGEGLRARLAERRAALEAARAAEHHLVEAESTRARLRAEADRVTAAHEQATSTLESLGEQVRALGEQAEDVGSRLAAAVAAHDGCPCGGSDPARHREVAAVLTGLARAEAAVTAARSRLAGAQDDLAGALAEAGFPDADAARDALLPAPEADRLRDAVLGHERAVAAATAVLAEPEVDAALAGQAPDLEALAAAHTAARRLVLEGSSQHEALTRAARAVDRLRPRLEEHCRGLAELTGRHARVRELADAVGGTGGENTLRMRLTSFVLAARLEKVAALANERLAVMGSGRYLLEHSDDRAARGARSGLGLRVLDQWTGRVRDTATLSGGESFMASLALALGLADAVREEAGGLDLGTLFVDEGFGSLDEDSLDQVVGVLDGLREGGRAVGVVSHVPDLRARIGHQVVVTKGSAGSTVAVRVAGVTPAA
ncbi:SMC family ATPase [Phycicoccus endophyticus]|uniref:Nuclease SbcCD subunit C n=1 Tax=Phycicoccus endophyticus TaxID=1690220 RepID=A0A7G9R4M6_9MICO|nr:SMC family ATPase [Phycicoccus endophyticus]NHI18448.1 SMC family ATPase [Phycicoccus endophyticus]QNN50551.1 SMC family ATPase [Phycicoccus endophyticus]